MKGARLAIVVSLSLTLLAGCETFRSDFPSGNKFSIASKRAVGMQNRMASDYFGYDNKALLGKVKQISHTHSLGKSIYKFDQEGRLVHFWTLHGGIGLEQTEDYTYREGKLTTVVSASSSGSREVSSLIYDTDGNLIRVQTSGGYRNHTKNYRYEIAGHRIRMIISGDEEWLPVEWEIDPKTGHPVSIRSSTSDRLFNCEESKSKSTRTCIIASFSHKPKPERTLTVHRSDGLPILDVSPLDNDKAIKVAHKYVFDSSGNWVQHEVVQSRVKTGGAETHIDTRVGTREIIYY